MCQDHLVCAWAALESRLEQAKVGRRVEKWKVGLRSEHEAFGTALNGLLFAKREGLFLRMDAEHAVGRTHTIVRLQTIIRRKDGTENFGGFVYVLDEFVQRDFVLWVFVCSVNFSVSFSGYHAEGYHAPPIPYGYHGRTDTFKLTGYHVCRVTTPELQRSKQTFGYRRVIPPAGSF